MAFEAIRRGQMDVSAPRNLCSRTRVKDIPCGGPGLAAFGGPFRDLSPEKVDSLICGLDVDWVFIYFCAFVQRALFYFIGVRVSGVDWLFACLCFVLFCLVLFSSVVVLLVVLCAT